MDCLATMTQDRLAKSHGLAIVHQSRAQTDSPQRSGAYFVATAFEVLFRKISRHHLEDFVPVVLPGRLQDAVASTDVVHQEIPIRVKCYRPERDWDRICSPVD